MHTIKFHDLRCFDAVVSEGSFQAAAVVLARSHPSVFSAVGRLEQNLGLALLNRSGYRVELTDAGRVFHAKARLTLREIADLETYANQLASGEETVLRVVIGDLCPRPAILKSLSEFFGSRTRTRLHLEYEAVSGPLERLSEGHADLVFHRADPSDPRFERTELFDVAMVPVVAPGFLPFLPSNETTPDQLRSFTQCVIRDTAQRVAPESYFLVEGAHQCSVPDHVMKKELILHKLAWGHLPAWLIEDELREGRLISIAGMHLPGRIERLAAIRRRQSSHGPALEALWLILRDLES